jgi:nucleoid-associated protein EbfC
MFDMKKAMEMKKKMDEVQARLENISVDGESGDGKYKIEVTVTATKKVKSIRISDELMQSGDKEHLEDLLLIAIERAMEKAQGVAEAEARSTAMGGGLSGLFGM